MQCVKWWLRTFCIWWQVGEQWFQNFLFSYMVDALFEYLFNTQLETRICSWMYGSEAQGRGPAWWYTYKSHQRMIKPWDSVRCFSQLPLGYAAGTNNPSISVVHKQRVLKFPSLYLFSGAQMSCLCSVLICMSSSFWRLGWRSSLHLGLMSLVRRKAAKADNVVVARSFVQVWHSSLIGFTRTKGRLLCAGLFPTFASSPSTTMSSDTHLSATLIKWSRYLMCELSWWLWRGSMSPCVWGTCGHILPSPVC